MQPIENETPEQRSERFIATLRSESEVIVRSRKTRKEYRGVVKEMRRLTNELSQRVTESYARPIHTVYLIRVNGGSIRPFDQCGIEIGNKGGETEAARIEYLPEHRRDLLLRRELFAKLKDNIEKYGEDSLTSDRLRATLAAIRQTQTERTTAEAAAKNAINLAYESAKRVPTPKPKAIESAPNPPGESSVVSGSIDPDILNIEFKMEDEETEVSADESSN